MVSHFYMIPLSALMKGLLWEAFFCFIGHQIKLTAGFIRRMSAACQWFHISLLPEEDSQFCEEGLIIYHIDLYIIIIVHDIAWVQSCCGVWDIMDIPSQMYQ